MVTNDVIQDSKVIFGLTFIEMCDEVSLKPPVFTWLGTPYEYGFVPPSSAVNSITLDDEFGEIQEKEVKEMLRMGVIQPSTSNFNSPTVLVNKPDGNKRHCDDYSFLNRFLCDYDYQLPLNLFTALDLRHGYLQVNLAEKDRHIMAFSTSLGKFEYRKAPMGLKTSPRFFQSVMHRVFEGMINKSLESYPDALSSRQSPLMALSRFSAVHLNVYELTN